MTTSLGRMQQRPDRRPGRGRRSRSAVRALAILGIAIAGLALVGGIALYVVLNGLTNPVHFDSLARTVAGTRVNILVMGLDAPINQAGRAVPDFDIHKGWTSRTDTMMLFSVDARAGEIDLLSLPRDSRVIIAGREDQGYDKLGHAYAYGGPDMAIATVSKLLGVPIHYYVSVNSAGLASIIDLLGGVELFVEEDMHYRDPYQDFYVDLSQGLQVLDGDKSVQYLRYRSGSDIDRIGRQQKFLKAFKEQVFRLGTVARLPAVVGELADSVATNMTAGEMLSYARLAAKMNDLIFKTGTLPGENRIVTDPGREPLWYWALHDAEGRKMVDELVWGVDAQANAQITVEVQNGAGVPGLAAQFAEELGRQGYNVVAVTDSSRSDFKTTEVIDRSRDPDKLRRLSQLVLRYLPDADLGRARPIKERAQFTVILGQDYAAFVASGGTSLGGLHGSEEGLFWR